jgi:maltose/moltooligosaccharide transporter
MSVATPGPSGSSWQKPRLNYWQIWNMSFGFLGIQFGWGLQMANMSAIYEYLGADPHEIPILWLAAPLTGLIVQPIIGYMSDRTWSPRFGRRKPYFLVGAILASIALIFMPNSSSLWMAAGLLWILDASINISMEPFRAFVADMLPEDQQTRGFTMQSMFIGLGAVVASALPFILTNFFNLGALDDCASTSVIPLSVKISFYAGAVAFISAVLYTVLTTKEYPPVNISAFQKAKEEKKGFGAGVEEIFYAIRNMPTTMRQLALVQILTWPGLFLMWFYFGVATTRSVFQYDDSLSKYEVYHKQYRCDEKAGLGTDFAGLAERTPVKDEKNRVSAEELTTRFGTVATFQSTVADNIKRRVNGNEWGGVCFAFYSLITFLVAFLLPSIASRFGKKRTHAICLTFGAVALLSVGLIHNQYLLLLPMTGVGIAWASILSMPYAILAPALPAEKTGIYMGIFNFFIVLPEIAATVFFGWVMENLLDNNRIAAVTVGGGLLALAALMCLQIREKKAV